MVHYDEMGEIRKGPWKAEEDKVLINHVKKYGPRNWSSIRSKGLLQRTGKSCRLRWVNKLRPDLKSGVKFSAEEERTVIDLQAQFGNKWARIATYLSGRTDNDVKNFWSSRRKRMARMLQNSASSSSGKSRKSTKEVKATAHCDVPSLSAPNISSSTEEESLTKSQSCSSSLIGDSETISVALEYPDVLGYENSLFQINYTPPDKKPFIDQQSYPSFPSTPQLQPDFPLPLENQDYITRLEDPYFLDVFGQSGGSALGSAQIPIVPSYLGSESGANGDSQHAVTSDSFIFDDFPPIDMFDHIEPLPSPSDWS